VLVGHSWGALVALAYAGGARGGPKSPAGLVLVDGGIGHLRSAPGATWPAVREALTPPRVDGRPLDELRGWLHQPGRVWIPSAEEEELILANFIVREGRIWPRLTFERHMQIVRAMWDFPLYRAYSNVRCPVVMLPVRPAASAGVRELAHYDVKLRGLEQAARRIRPLHVRWLDETVHDVLLHRPGLVAQEVILFVRSLEPAR
jgi:pimeloyl-ACP methyl ester carboxylesterase